MHRLGWNPAPNSEVGGRISEEEGTGESMPLCIANPSRMKISEMNHNYVFDCFHLFVVYSIVWLEVVLMPSEWARFEDTPDECVPEVAMPGKVRTSRRSLERAPTPSSEPQ